MNKPVKWIIAIAASLVILLIIIIFSLPLLIDPNDYKSTITEKVRQSTGRELTIPGDIKLDVSLIGLDVIFKLGQIRLSSGEEFSGTPFFAGDQAEISLSIWPLITSRDLQVDKIRLQGIDLNLIRKSGGQANWEDLTGGEEKAAAGPSPAGPGEKKNIGLNDIDIGGVVIKDINVSFVDRQAGRTARLNNFNLETGHIRSGNAFPLTADFDLSYDDGKGEPLTAEADLKTGLTLDMARQQFAVDALQIDALLKGGPLPAEKLDLKLTGDLELDLPAEKAVVNKLTLRQGDFQAETVLTINGFAQPRISGSLNIPPFSPRSQAEKLGISLPMPNQQSLNTLSARMKFSYDPARLDISSLLVQLDETTVQGTASAVLAEQPAYEMALHIDQLDLDRYAIPTTQTTETETKPAPTPESSPRKSNSGPAPSVQTETPLLPAEQLRRLTFAAKIAVDRLKAAGLTATNINIQTAGRDGLITLKPLKADLYQGTIEIDGTIDARPEKPRLKMTKKLAGVQLGPLFVDLVGKEEIKGTAEIQADVTTSGLTKKELTANANGTISLSMVDGEIARLQIIDTIRTAKALLGSGQLPSDSGRNGSETDSGPPTTFAVLTATGIISNGVIKNNDLLARSELMKVEGKGTVNLTSEEIDYLLTVYLAKTLARNEKTGLVELADTPIPYRITGTFDNIRQSAALEEVIKTEAKKALFKELEKQLDKNTKQQGDAGTQSSGETKDLLKRGLESIFGN